MNFFGHAVLAQRSEAQSGTPPRARFVLGAMLPDFASMLRCRPPRVSDDTLAEGVRFHHLSDDAFHGSQSFLEFSRQASSFLRARGLAKGSARAVAHVGVELILDAAFAADEAANEAYLSALESGLTERWASHIHWEDDDARTRFQHLCQTLAQRGAIRGDASAELIAQRLHNILAQRSRLAMDAAGQFVVRDWVVTARPMISSRATLLLHEVEQRLQIALSRPDSRQ